MNLIVAAAGHRDLHADRVPQLRRYVEDFLADLRRRLPNAELRIMTGMAAGADLMVAHVALQSGWKVDAVLPLPLERHLEDFDAQSADELRAVLDDPAVTCTVLSAPAGASLDAKHGAGRAVFYSNLTQALIERSQLLLALWDGKESTRAGGTADTVRRYLDAADPRFGSRFVYWIPARRSTAVDETSRAPGWLSRVGEALHGHDSNTMPQTLERQLRSWVHLRSSP